MSSELKITGDISVELFHAVLYRVVIINKKSSNVKVKIDFLDHHEYPNHTITIHLSKTELKKLKGALEAILQ